MHSYHPVLYRLIVHFISVNHAVSSLRLPTTRLHRPPPQASHPNLPELHRISVLSAIVHYTPTILATPPLYSVLHIPPCRKLHCAQLASRLLYAAHLTCAPRSRIKADYQHHNFPELRQLRVTPAISHDRHLDVVHVTSTDNVVFPVSPCCIHGSVS